MNKKESNMQKLTIDEIKKQLVIMLDCIDKICKENNIKYSLSYGTLLGAVRHKGFIPWDDDLDILMTRENYDRFLKIKKEDLMGLDILTNENKKYNLMFAKVTNPKIVFKSNQRDRYDNDQRLFIDIFPIDYLSDTKEEGIKIIKKNNFKLCLLIAAQWKTFYINKRHSFIRQIPRFIFFIMSRFVNSKKIIQKLNKTIKYDYKKYCYCLALNRAKIEIFPSDFYSNYAEIEFEGKKYSCIKKYDECLRIIYGNYMKLPPENKRIYPHSYDAYLIKD